MLSPSTSIAILLVSWFTYLAYGAIYRLYFSPIAKFPGPKLAALTRLYELYYEIVKGGQFTFKIGELHEQYGPIIRINPWELHVNDPEFYEVLYTSGGKKRDKYKLYCEQFGNPKSGISTIPHDLHRLRRAPLSKFFSTSSVTKLEPIIQTTVDKLCARLRRLQELKQPVTISLAFSCLTNDVVCEYAFARSDNQVETSQDFNTDIHDAMENASELSHVLKQFPWMITAIQKIPARMIGIVDKKIMSFINFQNNMASQIRSIMDGENQNYKSASHPTIFHEILQNDLLPPEEKKLDRLWQEGQVIIGGGTDTTARAMSVMLFHTLANPPIMERLQNELKEVMSDSKPTWNQLEKLPFFSAVISEGLRLSYGVSTHLQRSSPDKILMYEDWVIPPGTPVGMTSVLIHNNSTIFPNPKEFLPGRWLDNPRLSRYLVSFSKGSRQCLGMNLAYAEIYLCLANLIHSFPDMKLYDTTSRDVEIQADYYLPKASGRGVKVLLG